MAEEFKIVAQLGPYEITRSMNAATGQEDEWLELEGLAIDDTVDQKSGHFDSNCIFEMIDTVNAGSNTPVFENEKVMRAMVAAGAPAPVGVDSEHSPFWNHQMGYVTRAWAESGPNGETQMKVRLKLDLGLSTVKDLKRSLDKGVKLGLSIFGQVPPGKMFKEVHRSTGTVIERYKQVLLKRIAITAQPVNAHTWVQTVRRSMAPEDIEEMEITENEEVTRSAGEGTAEVEAQDAEAQVSENPAPAEETAPGSSLLDLLLKVRSEVSRSLNEAQMSEFDHLVDQALRNPDGTPAETNVEDLGEVETDVARSETADAASDVIEETSEDTDTDGLSQAALRQLGGMVQPEAAEVERSLPEEPVEEPVTDEVILDATVSGTLSESAQANVQRSIALTNDAESEYVSRAMLDENISIIQRALSPLPEFIERTNAALSLLAQQVVALEKDKATLVDEVQRLAAQRNGRQGLSVLRGFEGDNQPQQPEVKALWHDLPPAERAARLKNMKEAGLTTEATMIMMGLVPDPSTLTDEARRHIYGG